MSDSPDPKYPLSSEAIATLELALHRGSKVASEAMAKWLGQPVVIEVDSLDMLPIEESTHVMQAADEPICYCAVQMTGMLTGMLILAFDDESGLALSDLLFDAPRGTNREWTDLNISTAVETTNILSCAYLSSLVDSLLRDDTSAECLPSPPLFSRDFVESLLEFAVMDQVNMSDHILIARTLFEVNQTSLNWMLLFVPDTETMQRLPNLVGHRESKR